ncbi:ABC transporter ATP-binding protein [Kallotenue papyrolyticum]|uniref:ABC transporter ATP-binding protein n=1 Tax=Kallotenue papyrolyticum TaxID=1325125 RepID=UPI00046F5496|nr:ABC transporter ATP-binding protein [Kallotenue papyrolyticum]
MATIELRRVEKRFGDVHAVKSLDLSVADGEFVVLLGPSGCGKTTTLRMIAGLETTTAGEIYIDGRNVTHLRGRDRDIAFVFQLYALYPHLTVWENIAFPLKAQHEARSVIEQRVREVVRLLGIGHLLHLRPKALSGGDQQRVALARALVRRPAAFLMDEPLGALDADFRETMRAEIKKLHLAQHATTVYVTHDQIEAMAMGDRIVVMSNAEVQQIGTPHAVYSDPANLFVARFIGSPGMNLLPGTYVDGQLHLPGDNRYPIPPAWRSALAPFREVVLGFRPEAVRIDPHGALQATVYADDLHGAYAMLHLALGEEETIVHARVSRETSYSIGTPVRFDVDAQLVRFFDPVSERAIAREARHG